MTADVFTRQLTPAAFAPYGDVLACDGDPDRIINQGMCGRWHDRARLEAPGGRLGLSLFLAAPRTLPYALDMMERHPDGSQAFVPMTDAPFLITVAADAGGAPGRPVAFLTDGAQAINFHRGTWHGVLTPLAAPGRFAVIDRIGPGANLEEHCFAAPVTIRRG